MLTIYHASCWQCGYAVYRLRTHSAKQLVLTVSSTGKHKTSVHAQRTGKRPRGGNYARAKTLVSEIWYDSPPRSFTAKLWRSSKIAQYSVELSFPQDSGDETRLRPIQWRNPRTGYDTLRYPNENMMRAEIKRIRVTKDPVG